MVSEARESEFRFGSGVALDWHVLGTASRRLSDAVFSAMPELRQFAGMVENVEPDGLSLTLKIPSPTADPWREVVIWLCPRLDGKGDPFEPSIGFGPSHTHKPDSPAGYLAIISIARDILADQIVSYKEPGDPNAYYGIWLDLREPDVLLDLLTHPKSSGRAVLTSWSGAADRVVEINALSKSGL